MKKRIVIIDPVCRKPYSHETLQNEAMGGTEATVVRVAEAMIGEGAEVAVLQHNREAEVQSPVGVMYAGIDRLDRLDPTHIITLRSPKPMPFAFDRKPHAKQYLWLHDLTNPTDDLFKGRDFFKQLPHKPKILGVSQSHLEQIKGNYLSIDHNAADYVQLDYVYNPIDSSLQADPTIVRFPNKMVFFSSPHKGLKQVLGLFQYVRRTLPEVQLCIANPGYEPTEKPDMDGIVVLGKLKHSEMMKHVANAMCVFMPQNDWANRETFGIVFAEANAIGTPVVAHDMGAAREVLGDDQVIDTRDPRQVLGTVERYKAARAAATAATTTPLEELGIKPKLERFSIKEVIKKWLKILN